MQDDSGLLFFRRMSWVLLMLAVMPVSVSIVVECNVQRMVLLAFAAGMYVAMLVVLSMIQSVVAHRIKAEENERARQSDERKHKMEIDRSEREAERIRALEIPVIVIEDRNAN